MLPLRKSTEVLQNMEKLPSCHTLYHIDIYYLTSFLPICHRLIEVHCSHSDVILKKNWYSCHLFFFVHFNIYSLMVIFSLYATWYIHHSETWLHSQVPNVNITQILCTGSNKQTQLLCPMT